LTAGAGRLWVQAIKAAPHRSPDLAGRVAELEAELSVERLRRMELQAKLDKLLGRRFGTSSESKPPAGAEMAGRRPPGG
jgi:hypothetical protein